VSVVFKLLKLRATQTDLGLYTGLGFNYSWI